MTRSTRLRIATALGALLLAGAPAARATDAAAAADAPLVLAPEACPTDDAKAAERAKREAALAELGRRLATERREEGGMSLSRTGHNYGPYDPTAEPESRPRPTPPADRSK